MSEVRSGRDTRLILENSFFSKDERKIIQFLSRDWFITHIVGRLQHENRTYKYFFMLPVAHVQKMFNFEHHLVVILAPNPDFKVEAIDVVDIVFAQHPTIKIEKICAVLISKDYKITKIIKESLKSNSETRIIVPFSYSELTSRSQDPIFSAEDSRNFLTQETFLILKLLCGKTYFSLEEKIW